eukprot:GHVR01032874.1.p1 GENE.GHVR01032874.1~~GHVR01032874.1.p1  ORF type:complete len:321 (+),score=43.52 GHVR01032874.1:1-963(+)
MNHMNAAHYACENNNSRVLKSLSDAGISFDMRTKEGYTPLHYCVKSRCVDGVKLIVDKHPNTLNIQDNSGKTALNLSASIGLEYMVEYLMQYVDYNIPDEIGMTPLHTAAMRGYRGVVKAILDSDPLNAVNCDALDMFGRTPMYLAASNGSVSVVKLMKVYGCSTVITSGSDGTIAVDVSLTGGYKYTSKYLFKVAEGIKDLTNIFNIKHLIDVNTKDAIGDTPLHKAALSGYNYTFISGSKYEGNYYEQSPLHYASMVGNVDMVKVFIQHLQYISMIDMYNNTPLHFASMNGHEGVVKLLIHNGAIRDYKNIILLWIWL